MLPIKILGAFTALALVVLSGSIGRFNLTTAESCGLLTTPAPKWITLQGIGYITNKV